MMLRIHVRESRGEWTKPCSDRNQTSRVQTTEPHLYRVLASHLHSVFMSDVFAVLKLRVLKSITMSR
jgi:hypothetical protein